MGYILWGDAEGVAGAAAAGVDVGGFDGGVGLGDVEGDHFGGWWVVDVVGVGIGVDIGYLVVWCDGEVQVKSSHVSTMMYISFFAA